MGTRLFDREVVLNAGGLRIASRSVQGENKPILRVQFKVTRTLKKEPNTTTIAIYNLNSTSRATLQQKSILTILEAGYVDNTSQIFAGELQYGASVKQGEDWITTIQSSDGAEAFKSKRINVSFKGPVKITTLLQQAADAMGFNLGNLKEKIAQGSLREALQEMTNGAVLSGKAEKVFSRIAKQMGYGWSVQDGQIQLLGPKEVIASADAVLLSPGTGLIGSPEPGEDGVIKARSLLQPDLLPGRRIQVSSRDVDGFFRVEKVTFTGDTWEGDWYSDVEAKPL